MEFDIHSSLKQNVSLPPAVITANGTTVGSIIDTKGFESCEFMFMDSAYTDGDFSALLEESDDPAFATSQVVSSTKVLGQANAVISAANQIRRIGSIGKLRFQRLSIISANVTTGATITAMNVLGNAQVRPVLEV